jgi:hypothetical protein
MKLFWERRPCVSRLRLVRTIRRPVPTWRRIVLAKD